MDGDDPFDFLNTRSNPFDIFKTGPNGRGGGNDDPFFAAAQQQLDSNAFKKPKGGFKRKREDNDSEPEDGIDLGEEDSDGKENEEDEEYDMDDGFLQRDSEEVEMMSDSDELPSEDSEEDDKRSRRRRSKLKKKRRSKKQRRDSKAKEEASEEEASDNGSKHRHRRQRRNRKQQSDDESDAENLVEVPRPTAQLLTNILSAVTLEMILASAQVIEATRALQHIPESKRLMDNPLARLIDPDADSHQTVIFDAKSKKPVEATPAQMALTKISFKADAITKHVGRMAIMEPIRENTKRNFFT
jgi:hypothetical protein